MRNFQVHFNNSSTDTVYHDRRVSRSFSTLLERKNLSQKKLLYPSLRSGTSSFYYKSAEGTEEHKVRRSAAGEGFGPSYWDPKSHVLPLDDPAIIIFPALLGRFSLRRLREAQSPKARR